MPARHLGGVENRGALTEGTGMAEHPQLGIAAALQRTQLGRGGVGAAIVDHDDLKGLVGQCNTHFFQQGNEVASFVFRRNQDRHIRSFVHGVPI